MKLLIEDDKVTILHDERELEFTKDEGYYLGKMLITTLSPYQNTP